MSEAARIEAAVRGAIHDAYRSRTKRSAAWHERASAALVAGVSGTVRYFEPYPLYFAGGAGAIATDLDDNSYVDFFLCGACLLLGHRHPELMAALAERAGSGSLILNPTLPTETAEQLQAMVPAAERVRFVNSGTEAVMSALRFARAFTGRDRIIKFNGIYHGMDDQVLVGLDGRGVRVGNGIPKSAVADIVTADFADLDALRARLRLGDIATVLIDPSMHHGGLWAGSPDHYRAIADAAHQAGSLVIFDEVISGFRLAPGGAQEYFGVVPDLAVFAKAFAAGEKLGAIVGRADVMGVADPSSRRRPGPFAFQSGTGNDSTFAQTAALTAMRCYARLGREGRYAQLAALAASLGSRLERVFAAHGIACHANTLGPMVRLFLTDGPIDYAHCSRLPRAPIDLFHLAMVSEGVLTLPGSNDFFLSFAHGPAEIEATVAAADRVLGRFEIAALVGALARESGSRSAPIAT